MNGLPCGVGSRDAVFSPSFGQRHAQEAVAYRTEMEVYCKEADVAGSIDLILYDPVGTCTTSSTIRGRTSCSGFKGFSKMKPPLTTCKIAKGLLRTAPLFLRHPDAHVRPYDWRSDPSLPAPREAMPWKVPTWAPRSSL